MNQFPEQTCTFCAICGAQTHSICPQCRKPIRGARCVQSRNWVTGSIQVVVGELKGVPAYCSECSEPLPWTIAKLNAAREFAEEIEGLSDEERGILKKSLDDLIRETPQTEVAALRFKRLVAKSGKVTLEGFKHILIDIVSEGAKKILFP